MNDIFTFKRFVKILLLAYFQAYVTVILECLCQNLKIQKALQFLFSIARTLYYNGPSNFLPTKMTLVFLFRFQRHFPLIFCFIFFYFSKSDYLINYYSKISSRIFLTISGEIFTFN